MTFSVLVVDDYAAWRERVCLEVQTSARWRIVGEAADGLEAVRQAGALAPDLILLDIGLPSLNGLDAARRIIAANSAARILFLSEHRAWTIVEAACATGARGYLCKSEGGARLLAAMEAVMAGVRFVSAGLDGDMIGNALCADAVQQGASRHVAAFYADEAHILEDFVRFAERSLAAGSVFILLANGSRRDQLHERLLARGVDVDGVTGDGRYLFVDFAHASPQWVSEGRLDEGRFAEATAALFNEVSGTTRGGRPRIALCGEGAPCLGAEGRVTAGVCIERLRSELSKTWAVDSLCAYDADMLGRNDDSRDAFHRICTEHSAIHFRGSSHR
jgi:DNA-binding NarL/FixJ family response regulator